MRVLLAGIAKCCLQSWLWTLLRFADFSRVALFSALAYELPSCVCVCVCDSLSTQLAFFPFLLHSLEKRYESGKKLHYVLRWGLFSTKIKTACKVCTKVAKKMWKKGKGAYKRQNWAKSLLQTSWSETRAKEGERKLSKSLIFDLKVDQIYFTPHSNLALCVLFVFIEFIWMCLAAWQQRPLHSRGREDWPGLCLG